MVWLFGKKAAAPAKPLTKEPPRQQLDLDKFMAQSLADPKRDQFIRGSMQALCVEDFPDNEENLWTIRKILNRKKTSFVMMEPEPKDVGADLFVFFVHFAPGPVIESLASYAIVESGSFLLQATAANCPEDIPQRLQWTVEA